MLALCRYRERLRDPSLPISPPPAAAAKLSPQRPLDSIQPHADQCRQASVPILHSAAENTPLGRTLRRIVNGEPGLGSP